MPESLYPAKCARPLAIALLDDDNGISNEAWELLQPLLLAAGDCDDILRNVAVADARWYLPEDYGKHEKGKSGYDGNCSGK